MSHQPAIKHFFCIFIVLISCNKKIVINKDKSCSFRKADFYIEGPELNDISISLNPWHFYKKTDSLLGRNQNLAWEYSAYLNQKKLIKNWPHYASVRGCADTAWIAKVLVKEYEKRFGTYRIDTLFPIDIYDAKIVDSSKLHIVPIQNFTEDDLDSLFSLSDGMVVTAGAFIEDKTLPGNKIYYNVGIDSLGSYFDTFNAPHTMLLNSIRRRTSPQYVGGIKDYVIKEDKIGHNEKRININYRMNNYIFYNDDLLKKYFQYKVGPEAFIKYCKEHHGVEVWLDRTDTFLVKKIKFRK